MRRLTSVNSKLMPLIEVLAPRARVRLRLLNAVSARVMFVGFDRLRPTVLAIDSAPCEAFAPLQNMLPIGPGARFDVMVDLPAAAGREARLVLHATEGPDQPLLVFKTEGEPRRDMPPIASLPPNPLLPLAINLKASRKLDLTIDGGPKMPAAADPPEPFRLDGAAADDFGRKPLFSVRRGTPVTLGFVNKTLFAAQIRVHGHHLRLLHDQDDGWEPYWRDSVIVPEQRTKHVAFVADNPGKWAIECLPLPRKRRNWSPGSKSRSQFRCGAYASPLSSRRRKTGGRHSGMSSEMRPGPNSRAAAACSQTAALAASKTGMDWANKPPIIPASTSPEPAVASQGGAAWPIVARPCGSATTVSAPLSNRTAPMSAAPARARASFEGEANWAISG